MRADAVHLSPEDSRGNLFLKWDCSGLSLLHGGESLIVEQYLSSPPLTIHASAYLSLKHGMSMNVKRQL